MGLRVFFALGWHSIFFPFAPHSLLVTLFFSHLLFIESFAMNIKDQLISSTFNYLNENELEGYVLLKRIKFIF